MPVPLPGRLWVPLCAGAVLGPALQLQQAALWPLEADAAIGLGALALFLLAGRVRPCSRLAAFAGAALLAFALCGARATLFLQDALDPALQGTDLVVTGTVASMP